MSHQSPPKFRASEADQKAKTKGVRLRCVIIFKSQKYAHQGGLASASDRGPDVVCFCAANMTD